MIVEVKVPQLSESVAEATLLEWHKQAGDAVARDENLIEIETDKVVMELPSPADGVLVEIVKAERSAVSSGEVIARIDTEARAAARAKPAEATSPSPAPAPAAPGAERTPPPVMPAARKLAEEKGLDASKIQGSGRDGRVTKADVLAHVGKAGSYAAAQEAPPAA
ncbi:MAG: biotin/lipoyl-containing protein, partial [Burkholderiales bacterium]|nr:biotin/lipoyl-containing protein [Burkholderiales bacterium]